MSLTKSILIPLILLSHIIYSQTTIVDSILSGGIYRNYRLYIPAVYNGNTARPLIINLHGYTSNASTQQIYSNFMPIADTANFLMVYPNGTQFNGQPFWNAGMSSALVNDIGFISNLIDSLKAQYNIDLDAVYSCGMSNGGFMSHALACELSNRIAAIASVTGSIFTTQYGVNCHPTRPVPVMQIHGTTDPTVPYIGGSNMMPVDSVINYWVSKNGCNPTPVFSNVPNTNLADGCTAEHYVFSGGLSNSSVELFKIINGTHTWPGFLYGGVGTNLDINASKEIWRFFRKYKLNQLTSIQDYKNVKNDYTIFPNPAQNSLFIDVENDNQKQLEISIFNTLGETIIHENLNGLNTVNISTLLPGIYYVAINKEIINSKKFIKY